jgi:hypothetical protein
MLQGIKLFTYVTSELSNAVRDLGFAQTAYTIYKTFECISISGVKTPKNAIVYFVVRNNFV